MPAPRLQLEDVTSSTADHRSPVLFEASNALEARDLKKGLASLRSAFTDGIRINQDVVTAWPAVAPILLGSLHRTYVKLLRYHLARAAGDAERDAATAAGVSPKAASYFVQRARQHDLPRLIEGHHRFVEADLALKGEKTSDPQRVLEGLLIDVLG